MTIASRRPAPNALVVRHDAERNVYEKQRALAADLARPLSIVNDEGEVIATTHPLPDNRGQAEDDE